jgi:hypothetical protein
MDRWLNDAPSLAHVKGFCTWVMVNNNCKVIAWTEDPAELAWLSGWMLEYTETQKKEADLGVGDGALKMGGRRSNPVSPLRSARKAG